MEHWKNIKGYEGHYQVSNLGRIKSIARKRGANIGGSYITKEMILKPILKNTGYIQNTFCKNNESVAVLAHIVVAKHFIKNPKKKPQVNHKNGIKSDNRVDNLEWATSSEQTIHSYQVLGQKPHYLGKFSSNHPTSKAIIQKDVKGNIIKEWDCAMDAVRLGFDSGCISRCCSGRNKTHKGFIWEYEKH